MRKVYKQMGFMNCMRGKRGQGGLLGDFSTGSVVVVVGAILLILAAVLVYFYVISKVKVIPLQQLEVVAQTCKLAVSNPNYLFNTDYCDYKKVKTATDSIVYANCEWLPFQQTSTANTIPCSPEVKQRYISLACADIAKTLKTEKTIFVNDNKISLGNCNTFAGNDCVYVTSSAVGSMPYQTGYFVDELPSQNCKDLIKA